MTTEKEIMDGNRLIAEMGGWNLVTNFPPHVYSNGLEKINNICFHKKESLGRLLEVVDKLEQKYNLYIIIKRRECIIQRMKLAHNATIISIDSSSKQLAIWEALVQLYNTLNPLNKITNGKQ